MIIYFKIKENITTNLNIHLAPLLPLNRYTFASIL